MVTKVISRYEILENIDQDLVPLENNDKGSPGLSFSGGADSSAALAIMPSNTVPIFLNRPMQGKTLYNSDAPLKICEILKEVGYDIRVVESNLEEIRKPTGFPTDLANSIPAIILSQYLNLDSISFGTVLESAFGIGHEKYIEYGKRSHWRFYDTLFSAVGIKLSLPTAGISEVGTGIISLKSDIAKIGQSCIRGTFNKPCYKCWKCFRKELLMLSISDDESSPPNLFNMLKNNEVQLRLSAFPISHENVITYSLQRLDLEKYRFLVPISKKLDMKSNLDFLNRWYSESIEFIPDKYRHHIRNKIIEFLEISTFEDNEKIINWDMNPHLSSNRAINNQDKLISYWQDIDVN
jgi:hypothetical protein